MQKSNILYLKLRVEFLLNNYFLLFFIIFIISFNNLIQ